MGLNAPHVTPDEVRKLATTYFPPRIGIPTLIEGAADTIEAQAAEIERLRAFVAAFDAWQQGRTWQHSFRKLHDARRAIDEAQA